MKIKNKAVKGFTLGEIVTTTAIIGILAAVAIPNYLRIRMNVNMELVKQHLKTIGEEMNELSVRNREFPDNINNLGNSDEEIAITASLNAIDQRGYTRNGYQTFTNRTNYQLRTCPKDGLWGVAGDRCFVLTPLGLSEEQVQAAFNVGNNPWDAPVNLNPMFITTVGSNVLGSSNISEEERVKMLAAKFEQLGLATVYNYDAMNPPPDTVPSSFFLISADQAGVFNDIFPSIYQNVKDQGISMFKVERETNAATFEKCSYCGGTGNNLDPSTTKVVEIGFRLDHPITEEAFNTRFNELQSFWDSEMQKL